MWARVFPRASQRRGDRFWSFVHDMLLARQWNLVEALSNYALREPPDKAHNPVLLLEAHWLALKRLGRLDELREDISDIDVNVLQLPADHTAAIHALRGEVAEAIAALRMSVRLGQSTIRDLLMWPLLEEVRATPEFTDLLTELMP